MDCQQQAADDFYMTSNPPNPSCWLVEGLPDMLDEGDLDEFSRGHGADPGPRADTSELNGPNIRLKWRTRGPKASRLIQLAFHDCLR